MLQQGQASRGRWGLGSVLLALAVAGCVAAPGTEGTGEGKVSRRTTTVKPPTTGSNTSASKAPGGLTGEKPGEDPRSSDDPSLARPSLAPSAGTSASASPGGGTASADPNASTVATTSTGPNASPTPAPSTEATPEPEPTDGPIQRVSRFWGARVLLGGTHGTPTDGSGAAAILGQNLGQAPGLLGLPVGNPTRLYFADTAANQIRSLDVPADANASASIRLEVGDPARQLDGGTGGVRGLRQPTGLAADAQGRIVFVERDGNRMWRYDPASYNAGTQSSTQTVTQLAGGAVAIRGSKPNDYVDGPGASATLFNLASTASDGDTVYFADAGYLTIRQAATGDGACPISFTAGPKAEQPQLFTDPPPTPPPTSTKAAAAFMGPRGIAVGTVPNGATGAMASLAGKKVLYVAESFRHCIRAIDLSSDQVVTVVGGARTAGSQDGPLASATLSTPWALAVDGKGVLYVGEVGFGSHRLRAIDLVAGKVQTVVGESTEGGVIRAPDTNIPRGRVELGHVGAIVVVNGPDGSASKFYLYDYGATADTENPASNATKPGPRILELKPVN